MAAPLFTNRMIAVNPDRTWSFESLQRLQSLVSLAGGDTGDIAATRITVSPTGTLSSTNAQAAFAELDAEKEATGTAAAAVVAHVALADPHTQYATDAALAAHTGDTANPHSVTKAQVGLGSADNTSDANKPVSTAQAAADAAVQAFSIQRANHTGDLAMASGSIGYAAGNGGAVTQLTNKTTAVSLNELSGEVTMNNAALAAGATVTFTMNNTTSAATDLIVINPVSGTANAYKVQGICAASSVSVSVTNETAGSLSEAVVLRFAIFKAATS
jgi:hypothetical protein